MTELTIVIVNYNATDYLDQCLESIARETQRCRYRVVVVDNASTDQDTAILKENHPTIDLICNQTNLGFATACNQGIRLRPSSHYLLLNPDSLILDQAIDRSLEFLSSRPDAAIVGCRVLNPDGTLQLASRRSIPRLSTALYRFFRLSLLFPRSKVLARYNLTFLDEDSVHAVEAVSGSFLMFRAALLEGDGFLDESFFLYGEDLDFCYRALQKGWKVLYYPGAKITHFKRRSSHQRTRKSTYHYYEAMGIFYRKHYAARSNPLKNALVLAGIQLLYWSVLLKTAITGRKDVGSPY